ncbi:hypothetical protein CkaCkLH20_09115 [Colletotrichum karsti]|uniref:Uncharacterized protein n=1 Tax=Colletotrichum karsti TaxID=1095194 RepID=A0A9P6LI72_9PEZI|nr:uncharacterized protein CkaCkLH20_09115 [Colletotrichum karsti]KAF9873302.1 hypothetical protein CkaCkLH20_09115 [Colletotrichum karsti]
MASPNIGFFPFAPTEDLTSVATFHIVLSTAQPLMTTLLSLPREIRDDILRFALPDDRPAPESPAASLDRVELSHADVGGMELYEDQTSVFVERERPTGFPSLLLVNKQIHAEVLPLLQQHDANLVLDIMYVKECGWWPTWLSSTCLRRARFSTLYVQIRIFDPPEDVPFSWSRDNIFYRGDIYQSTRNISPACVTTAFHQIILAFLRHGPRYGPKVVEDVEGWPPASPCSAQNLVIDVLLPENAEDHLVLGSMHGVINDRTPSAPSPRQLLSHLIAATLLHRNQPPQPIITMANSSEGLDNLSTMFEWRFHEIWRIHADGRPEEAEISACELLMEPRLGSLHRAGLHLLLAGSPHDYVEHAKEAVRLYTEVKQQYQDTFSSEQKANIEKMLDAAKASLHKARTDEQAINRDMERATQVHLPRFLGQEANDSSAAGETMNDFHDASIKQAIEPSRDDENEGPSDHGVPEPILSSSQNVPRIVLPSNQTAVETIAGGSQHVQDAGHSQSSAVTDLDDDTTPLPEIKDFQSADHEKA